MHPIIGNDIIDLASPHARGKGRNPRFIQKVLTSTEQTCLSVAPDPDLSLWSFWAAKESAFKAVSRHMPHVPATPKTYEVMWHSEPDVPAIHLSTSYPMPMGYADTIKTGTVITPAGTVNVFCQPDSEKIVCLCLNPTPNRPVILSTGIFPLPHDSIPDFDRATQLQSLYVREKAIISISSFFGIKPEIVEIRIESAVPEVRIDGRKSNILLSLSHDGRFVFFAWFCDDYN